MSNCDDKGFDNLLDLIKDLKNLDGRDIKETIFPMHSVISKNPKDAEERSNYEAFLRDSKIAEDKIDIIGENFLADMLKKHLG